MLLTAGGLTCAIYVLKLPFFNTYEASEPSDIRFLTEKQSFKDDIFVNKRYLSGHRYEEFTSCCKIGQ